MLASGIAMADPVAGCDPKVMAAMQAKAQAEVAYDASVTDQIVNKPDSVLAMTCFNQAAGVSSKQGGNIFSGDFTSDAQPIIGKALQSFYDDFGDADGYDGGTVDYKDDATVLQDQFNCNAMQNEWQAAESAGVDMKVPNATFNDMMSGALPAGAGDDYGSNWDAAAKQGVFSNLQKSVSDLSAPNVPDLSSVSGSCDALQKAGITSEGCANNGTGGP